MRAEDALPGEKAAIIKFCSIIALLLSGVTAYWFFRPEIYLFNRLSLRNSDVLTVDHNIFLLFLKHHFADGVWCLAVLLSIDLLRVKGAPPIYSRVLFALPFMSEALQYIGLIPGTFDWVDLGLYVGIYFLYANKEVLFMKKSMRHLFGIFALAVFSIAILASGPPPIVYESASVTFKQKPDDIFTKPSLKNILNTSERRAIVLRVPASGEKVTQEEKQVSSTLYATIE
jgi:hypothetical protein